MEAEFREVAFRHVEALAVDMGLPVYWPNIDTQEQPEDEYLQVSVHNTKPESRTLCHGNDLHRWLLNISIYVRSGTGDIKQSEYVNKLREGIPDGQLLTDGDFKFKTFSDGDASTPPVEASGWSIKPVRFLFQAINQ